MVHALPQGVLFLIYRHRNCARSMGLLCNFLPSLKESAYPFHQVRGHQFPKVPRRGNLLVDFTSPVALHNHGQNEINYLQFLGATSTGGTSPPFLIDFTVHNLQLRSTILVRSSLP